MNQTKLLFIDSKVENYNHFISQVDSQTKVVILQPNQNGIDKISQSLGECLDINTVHIISHGTKGTLYLGNSILDLDNIHQYADIIQQWGKYLSADAEILIYGCQVASGKEGREFVRQLHQLTGANIAASETLTGNAKKGGNWNLEVIFGQLKSALALTPEVRASYAGVLANIVVNTGDDVIDDSDGVTSLREAIIQANSTPEDDTIQLTAGATYNLTISGSDEDAAATGDLDIVAGAGEITVISEGEEKAVIDAGGETGINDRVFHVLEGATLELENVEVTGSFLNAASGGGIFNSGIVSLNNSTISGNLVTMEVDTLALGYGYHGGGIYNSGTATIANSAISSNLVTVTGFTDLALGYGTDGGGIYNSGRVSIINSTINGNSVSSGSGSGIHNSITASISISNSTISDNSAYSGGGIENLGTVSINNSTISGNLANSTELGYRGDGGGVNNRGTLNINNSTISDNSAYGGGGGGVNNDFNGMANIINSTISDNLASRGGGFNNKSGSIGIINSTISDNSAYSGGGIHNSDTVVVSNSTISNNRRGGIFHNNFYYNNDFYFYDYNPITTVTSSIISGNFTGIISALVNSDVNSVESNNTLISGGNNLIGTGNAINNFDGDNDQTGVTDPLLGDLADNGGPTLTHLPLPNSPAIDAGSNPNALTTDQRGEPRFVGKGVDIGAVELQVQQISGTPENDRLNGTGGDDTITGLAGNDTINGRGGDDQIIGSRGNDFLYGKDGNDTLEGRLGNDFLFGGNGGDSLVGGIGRDRFNGGAGDDTLTGGASIDRFIVATTDEFDSADIGIDTITDFVPEQDIILLDKTTFTAITSDSGTGFSVNSEFTVVTSDADAETSASVIVYNSNNGKLFYNANGIAAEFGSGGEFANLTNTASISGDDFFVRG